jgi:RNA polymerase sigma factor (sigma-70 family)
LSGTLRFPGLEANVQADASFQELLAAARRGADSAWREIYAELSPAVLGYLRGRGAAEPDDLTGEVFLQVVRDLERFEGDWRGFRAWVLAIAHHRLLDEARRRSRRPIDPVPDPADAPDREPAEDVADDIPVGVASRLGLERTTELLADLSPDQRSVILLRVVADLSLEEVGRVLGKRPGAVKQLQRRGLLQLRRRLEREGVAP